MINGPRDPSTPNPRNRLTATTPDEGRRAVDSIIAAGADFVKVHNNIPPETYRTILEYAQQHGLTAVGHVPHTVDVREASDLKQRSIEHMTGIPVACSSDEAVLRRTIAAINDSLYGGAERMDDALFPRAMATFDESKCAALARQFARNGTWLSPTLVVFQPARFEREAGRVVSPLQRYIPPSLKVRGAPYRLAGDRGALHRAARLYKGDILPGCAGEWIASDQERLRQRARQVLARLVDLLEQDRAFGDAIQYAQRSLRLDPLDEQSWCALMRCHARHGGRATALHLYQQCAALLKKELGIQPSAATRATYREILDLDAEAPVIPAAPRTLVYPLVGRNTEWRALLHAWHTASAGRPELFLIRGEAGIGKSRLAEELVGWCGRQRITVLTARCYAGEGRLAYAPIAAWLKSDALQSALTRLDAASLTDVARLRPEIVATRPDIPAPERDLESWHRLRFFEALAQTFRSAGPLLLVLDDLQWADAETIEWLHYFLRSAGGTPCLVIGTLRGRKSRTTRRLDGCSLISNAAIC